MKERACQLLAAAVVLLLLPASAFAQKLILVVRHAERADAGMAVEETDPRLSATGAARAQKLAVMLAEAGITGIYASEYIRTKDTAKPLADRLKLPVESIPSRDTAALVASIRKKHASEIVLVVGHSSSLPLIIAAFGGPRVVVGDEDYGDLYVIVPSTGTLTRIKF